jgi:hypothetical protein
MESSMVRLIALLSILSCGGAACAAPITATLVVAAANVATFDPNLFAPGPAVDVYNLVAANPNPYPVSSIGLSLNGDFINLGLPSMAFKAGAELPTLGPNKVAETFFVVPDPSKVLAVGTIDSNGSLASNYTTQGGATLIPAQGSSVVAVLSLAAGSPFPSMAGWTGNAAINGVLEPGWIFLTSLPPFPEPTSGVLAGLALVGAAARRRG